MKALLLAIFIVVSTKSAHQVILDMEPQLFDTNEPLHFSELAEKYGQQTEEYEVTTQDGYILGLFRIPGTRGLPILLMHGFTDTSDTWLLRGHKSLGITLAQQNYDLWFGNIRGNKYSRRHIKLNPDTDALFWDYSFHEHGYYDLPAIIDTILSKTGANKLTAFGHSQGNTIFYVMGSTRPEYNQKINVMTALAPICYLTHVPPPLSYVFSDSPELNDYLELLGVNELFGEVSFTGQLVKKICDRPLVGYALCVLGVLFPMTGFDAEEFPPYVFNIVIKRHPAGTTRKNFYHFAQVSLRKRFSKFDYGEERNVVEYNSTTPPDYNLKAVTMPVVLLGAKNDKFSLPADVDTLRRQLPNVVQYKVIQRKLMNHLDFIWGTNMKQYLFPHIFDILEKFH